jgi:hypothetical protein
MMGDRQLRFLVLSIALATVPRVSSAQQPVADVLRFLVTNQSVGTGSFERDQSAAQATSDAISRSLLATLATLPVSTSSGAFTYRLDPELGLVTRTTSTFGPLFTERALTVGRGVASVGLTTQHLRFTRLDDRNLRDGTLVTTANQFVDEAAPFDIDHLTLQLDANVATLFATVGVTNSLEVGVAAPLVALRLDGLRVNTYRGRTFTEASATANSVGLADIATRAKYTVVSQDGMSLAAAVDAHLPTGSQENLLGAGTASLRMLAVGSYEQGRLAVHANLGGTIGGLSRELMAAAAFGVAASDHVTLNAEVMVRRLSDPGRLVTVVAAHPTLRDVQTLRLGTGGSEVVGVTAAPGVKWNITGTWVLVAQAAIPLTEAGLTAPVVPFIGIDWTPGR